MCHNDVYPDLISEIWLSRWSPLYFLSAWPSLSQSLSSLPGASLVWVPFVWELSGAGKEWDATVLCWSSHCQHLPTSSSLSHHHWLHTLTLQNYKVSLYKFIFRNICKSNYDKLSLAWSCQSKYKSLILIIHLLEGWKSKKLSTAWSWSSQGRCVLITESCLRTSNSSWSHHVRGFMNR